MATEAFDIQFGDSNTGVGIEFCRKCSIRSFETQHARHCYTPDEEYFDILITDDINFNMYKDLVAIMLKYRKDITTNSGTKALLSIQHFCETFINYRKGN